MIDSYFMNIDNKIINGLWIGDKLSSIELLTLKSFVAHGHEFHLWCYSNLSTQVPEGVICKDANEIIPQAKIFRYKHKNQFGNGKGSVAGFSDIFRYKLLYEHGGWWVDMDITCLKTFDIDKPYFFRKHHNLNVVGNVMKCPKGSLLMKQCYEEASAKIDKNNTDWHKPIYILNEKIEQHLLYDFIVEDCSNQDFWADTSRFVVKNKEYPNHWYFIHWQNEEWRSRGLNKNKIYEGSTLAYLMAKYNLPVCKKPFWQKNISVKVATILLTLGTLLLLAYITWETYWYTRVGLAFVKWHTHLMAIVLLYVLLLLGISILKRFSNSILFNYKNIILALTSICTTFLMVELLFIVSGREKNRFEKDMGFYNPILVDENNYYHTWTPNSIHQLKASTFNYQRFTNSLGFPDKEWVLNKADTGTIRIMCAGDSFTEGDGAPQDSCYPKILSDLLAAHNINAEVMNVGICGSDPFFNYMAYKDLLVKYQPQIILQTISENDVNSDYMLRGSLERFREYKKLTYKVSAPWWEPIFAISYLSRPVFRLFGLSNHFNEIDFRNHVSIQEAQKDFDTLFSLYKKEAEANGAKLILIHLPMEHGVKNGVYDSTMITLPYDIDSFNLLAYYQDSFSIFSANYQSYYWVEDAHHNSKGYQIMAQSIFQYLNSNGILNQ